MKQILIKNGGVVVEEVPAPHVGRRNILVRVAFSCVSVGTEIAGVKMSGLPLYKRALKQPENVKRVLEMAQNEGVVRTWDRVRGKLAGGSPTGYSAAGEVIAVGEEVCGFSLGDRVACAGAGIANHAEVIDVPVNLAHRIPNNVSYEYAATVTLGAIAMQGTRRAAPTIGETFVVVGLGLLGQLTAQFLQANGCRVVGVDLDNERIRLALENGMEVGVNPSEEDYIARVVALTGGFGADGVIITAATESNEVIREAMHACRKKGRVVLVGDVGLNLNRADFYTKELDFFISCSYGPGRYDPIYEEEGADYPLPYVRWTENRNMGAYLDLIGSGKVRLSNLCTEPYAVDRAPEAYTALQGSGSKPLVVLLQYPPNGTTLQRSVPLARVAKKSGRVGIGLVGAGSFAQGMHLPNLIRLRESFELRAVMSRTGASARSVAAQHDAQYATTDFEEVLGDPSVDLVMLATRHDLHGPMTIRALQAGKHVFVEKPLCLTEPELKQIERFYAADANGPVLMVGFNRRFSPAIKYVRELIQNRTTPLIVNYRMNAGYIPMNHWVHGAEGGGRNIGEACHIYDLFHALTDSSVIDVQAISIAPSSEQWARNDNFVATLRFAEGSVCTLTYTAMGSKLFPKESMDVFVDGKVITLSDYHEVQVIGSKQKGWRGAVQKGQYEELQALATCLKTGADWPISLEQQCSATRVSFVVERQISPASSVQMAAGS
jgi:predicted dehydrogenase/threonine dehydrogenase-like Zn-dependent dehydrogenase